MKQHALVAHLDVPYVRMLEHEGPMAKLALDGGQAHAGR